MSDERGLDRSDLSALAGAINAEHRACETAFRAGLAHAVRAGELLMEARALCPHGTWLPWVRENFEGSERLAQGYMQVARELPKLAAEDPQRVADLMSFREALAALAAAREPAQVFVHQATEPPRGPLRYVLSSAPDVPAETKRAALQQLARDPDVIEEAAKYGTPTSRAVAELHVETERVRKQWREQQTESDPIAKRLDQVGAALDVETICSRYARETDRFAREIAEALTRTGTVGERHLYWVRQAIERAESQLAQVKTYAETGRTDLDAFLQDVLGSEPDT